MKRILRSVAFLFIIFFSTQSFAQFQTENKAIKGAKVVGESFSVCYYKERERPDIKTPGKHPLYETLVRMYQENPEAARSFQDNLKTAEVIINFGPGFDNNAEARDAFRFAANLWELEVVSSVPVVINADFNPLGAGVLGSTGSSELTNVPGSPDPSLTYNQSIANSIAGIDLVPGGADMSMNFNSDFNWYFGLDMNTPSNLVDFVTVVLHEIGHGMGIRGSNGGCATGIGDNGGANPLLWDVYTSTGDGTPILDLGFASEAQLAAVVGNDLFMTGFNAVKALEGTGQPAKIYAPGSCAPGSSLAHWDESTFPGGDPNELMTPFISETIHDIGDFTRGFLVDAGWVLANRDPEFDIGVSNIVAPTDKEEFTNAEDVTVQIGNLGNQRVESVIISYKVDDGDWITEEFPGGLSSNQERQYTFTQTADLSVNDQYTITARVEYFIDNVKENDEAFKVVEEITVDPPDPITFPYQESWEGGSAEWRSSGEWQLGAPAAPIINSASDGTQAWVTNLTGNYSDQTTSILTSPEFNMTGFRDPLVEVDIWYDIETGWDGAALQVSTDGGANFETVGEWGDPNNWYTDGPERTGTGNGDDGVDALTAAVGNGNGWTGTGADGSGGWLTAFQRVPLVDEGNVIFRFVFASDQASNNEGFAVDNIRISPDPIFDNDVAVIDITSPTDGSLTNAETVTALVKNVGINEASNFDITYTINGGGAVTETIAGPLAAEEELSYSFTTTADLSATQIYDLEVSTGLGSDENPANDAITVQVENILNVAAFPYRESFEGGNGNWKTTGSSSSWELGTPAGAIINSASDGTQAWVTNLNGDYNNNEVSFLESPGFNFTGITEPVMGFDIWFEEEPLRDGVLLQYSVDNGESWELLGAEGDDANWYNRSDLATVNFDSRGSGWNWSSGGYWTVFHVIPEVAGESFVIFRFVFASDNVNTDEGVAVDNIRVFDNAAVDFTLTCSAPVAANTDAGQEYANLDPGNPGVTAPGSPTITYYNNFTNTGNPTGNYPVGDTELLFIVDVDGVLAFCTSTVTVTDNEAPVVNCPDDVLVALASGETEVEVSYEIPQAEDNYGFDSPVTYSNTVTPDGASGIACPSGPQSFIRAFDLRDDFGIESDYFVTDVSVGLQSVEGDGIPAKVNIYSFDQSIYDINDSDDFIFANMVLQQSQAFRAENDDDETLVNVPITAMIPAGHIAVVEFFTASGSDNFFPGANPDQNGESYLWSPGCGAPEPTNVEDVNGGPFPDAQWSIVMNGRVKTTTNTTLASGIGSGQTFPIGVNTESWRVEDINAQEGTCSFDVEVVSATFDAPVATAATANSGSGFTANWDAVAGVTFYQLFVFELPLNIPVPAFDGVVVNTTSSAVTGLDPSTPYGYNVRAVDGVNPTQYSTLSNTINTTTTIPAPNGLSAENVTDKTFELSWNSVSGISDYAVDVSTDNFATFVGVYDNFIVSDDELFVTDMLPGSTLQIRVRGVNEGDSSANSSTLVVNTIVETPFAQSVTDISENSFMTSWTAGLGAASYRLDVTQDGFNSFIINNLTVNGTSYEVTGLDPNSNYEYRVRSVDGGGNAGLNSNSIRTTTHAVPAVALDPINSSSYGFTAAWMGSNGVNTFEFDLSEDDFATIESDYNGIILTDTKLLILGLEPNTTYYYRVRAVSRLGVVTENSNTISFTTPDNTGDVPPPPVASEATGVGLDVFTASWTGTNTIYYTLDVSSDNFDSFLNGFEDTQLFTTTITIDDLDEDSDYQYRVRAFNNAGFSDYSNVVSVRTILGIEDLANLKGISAYPNPLRDRFNLVIDNSILGNYEIRLFDHTGRLLNVRELEKNQFKTTSELDLRFYPSGIYYLTVQTDKAAEVIKLIKK